MADQVLAGKAHMKSRALKFVVLIGVVSFFADFTYEGARSITGPFLAILGASATLVGFIAGFGELLGYGLRLVSGRLSERTGEFWPITLFGYVVQMSAVPLLALAPNWQIAGLLIMVERIGKAIRNPPRDVMLSHAAKQIGYGWGFGLHEALDQFGALFGPLVVAAVLAARGNYKTAFAILLVPAIATLSLLVFARFSYPEPEDLEVTVSNVQASGLPRGFWLALIGSALWGLGMGVHEPIIPAAVASMVPQQRRPSAYGIFTAGYGVCWFIGSVIIGRLYDVSVFALIVFSVLAQMVAIPIFVNVNKRLRTYFN